MCITCGCFGCFPFFSCSGEGEGRSIRPREVGGSVFTADRWREAYAKRRGGWEQCANGAGRVSGGGGEFVWGAKSPPRSMISYGPGIAWSEIPPMQCKLHMAPEGMSLIEPLRPALVASLDMIISSHAL